MDTDEINQLLIKAGYRKLYQTQRGEYIGSPHILKLISKANEYKLGRYFRYICPSSKYRTFKYGIMYWADNIAIYGQKLPILNHKILSQINRDLNEMTKILGMHIRVDINIYP